MDSTKVMQLTGRIVMIGSGKAYNSYAHYTIIDMECEDGTEISLENVVIQTKLNNYLNVGENVTIHYASTKNLNIGWLRNGYPFYIYAIKRNGKYHAQWGISTLSVALFRILGAVGLAWFTLVALMGTLQEHDLLNALTGFSICLIFIIPIELMIIRSVTRTKNLIKSINLDISQLH